MTQKGLFEGEMPKAPVKNCYKVLFDDGSTMLYSYWRYNQRILDYARSVGKSYADFTKEWVKEIAPNLKEAGYSFWSYAYNQGRRCDFPHRNVVGRIQSEKKMTSEQKGPYKYPVDKFECVITGGYILISEISKPEQAPVKAMSFEAMVTNSRRIQVAARQCGKEINKSTKDITHDDVDDLWYSILREKVKREELQRGSMMSAIRKVNFFITQRDKMRAEGKL